MKKITQTILFSFLTTIVFSQIPSDNLLLHLPFNNSFNDASTNNHNIIPNGTALTQDRFGNANSSASFDGVNDYIELPNILPTDIGTHSFWFKPQNFDNPQVLLYHSSIQDDGFGWGGSQSALETHTGIQEGGRAVYIFQNKEAISYANASGSDNYQLVSDKWYHMVLTYDTNGKIKFYIDNVLINEQDITSITGDNQPLYTYIGKPYGNLRYFKGSFDDLRVYSRVLTESEINALYYEGFCYETVTVTDALVINANVTGFNPLTYQNTISIYPNPTYDKITINFGDNYDTMSGYNLKILNTLGQEVYTTPINSNQEEVDLSSWTGNGVYYVHLINSSGHILDVKKIILE